MLAVLKMKRFFWSLFTCLYVIKVYECIVIEMLLAHLPIYPFTTIVWLLLLHIL